MSDGIVKPDGEMELAAVCTGKELTLLELRKRLREHLPLHMIPKRFIHLDRMLLNDRGKVDRKACAALLEGSFARPAER